MVFRIKPIDRLLTQAVDLEAIRTDYGRPEIRLDENGRLLLLAAFAEGQTAVDAYKAWRSRVPLDDIAFGAFRILGQVVQSVSRNRIEDPEIGRIQGALKHTWVANMLRTRALSAALQALDRAGLEVMVLKGAALIARYPELAQRHCAADFDILVRQRDASEAFAAMTDAGFRTHQFRFDLFEPGDLQKIHGFPLDNEALGGSVDLHWWPLPRWTHHGFVEELFASSELRTLGAFRVRVPRLEDHLYLTLARPEAWESDEIFARVFEAVYILRGCEASLDWSRVIGLCRRFHQNAMAGALLAMLKSELGVPIPGWFLSKLRTTCSQLSLSEFQIGQRPVTARTPREQFVSKAITLVRSHPNASKSILRTAIGLRRSRDFQRAMVVAAQELMPQQSAEQMWSNYAEAGQPSQEIGPTYVAGFSFAESEGRWTDGYSATMMVPVDAAISGRAQVRLTVVPFLAANKKSLRFEMCAGRGLAVWKEVTTKDAIPAEILIDADIVSVAGFRGVILAINLPEAARPSDLGHSEDCRLLGLFVRGVELCQIARGEN